MRRLLPLWKEVLHRRGSAIGDGGMLPHLEAFTRDLASGHFAPPGRDPGLVERARSILRRTPAGDAALASILARAERDLQPVALRDMLGSVSTVIESHDSVAGCYTRLGWEQVVQRELAGVRAELDRDRWVLSDQRANGEAERQALRDRYFQEYSAAWKHFLRGLSVRASADSHQALSDLQALTQDNPPFARILRFAVDQVSLAEPALDHDFAKLREFVGASGAKDSSLGQYLVGLGKLRNALSDFVEDGGDGTKLNDEVRAANELTRKLLLETLDESGRSMVRGLLEGPIGSASASVVKGSAESLSAAWAEEVYAPYKRSLWARYPFGKGADAPMADVVEFLKAGGVLWGFYAAKLGKLLPRQGVKFHPAKSYQRVFGPHFLRCLEAAAEWTDALVPPSAQKLQVDFEVRPQGVAQGVGELELEIDGQRRVYKNGPEEHWTFHWPGDKPGVTLVLRGRTGEVARLSVPGEWALLHFLDAGKLVSSKNGLYTYEWTLAKGAIKVPIVFKPARSVHPLHARPPLVCPSGVH
jgi:type VI secretion system protein ImpL